MRADRMIEILQTLDPATDVGPWFRAYKGNIIDTLDFTDAGKAIRIADRILGTPYSAMNTDSSGKPLRFRACVWSAKGGDADRMKQILQCCSELEKAGITAFKLTDSGWFYIHIQRDLYYSSFTSSDDPSVWSQRQNKRAEAKSKRDYQKELARAAQREQMDKEQKEWMEQHRKNQEEKRLADEKAAREAKEEAERRRKEAEALREQVRIAQEDPSRSIEVKGGGD